MRYVGHLIAYGFIGISAASNFLFAFSLARAPLLAAVYGMVGVLATFANAYIPVRLLQAWDTKRWSVFVAACPLLVACSLFSVTSALGFASAVRDRGTSDQAALSENYKTTLAQLRDEEAKKRKDAARIEQLREQIKTYRINGAMKSDDVQAAALEAIGIPDGRYWISLLFALLVEIGAATGLFIAFADTKAPPDARTWKPRV